MSYDRYLHWRDTPINGPSDLTVIVPTYNEKDRIVPTIAAISAQLSERMDNFDIIFSDDGSTDNTLDLVRGLGFANVSVIDPGFNSGKGKAVRLGVQAATGRYVLFTDVDMSTPIDEIFDFMKEMESGADVVIGSRAIAGAEEGERSVLRRVLSGGLRMTVRAVLKLDVRDPQCGFKLFSSEAAKRIFSIQRIDGFSFDAEVLFLAQKFHYTVKEMPVIWTDAPGSTVAPLATSLKFLVDLIRIRISALGDAYSEAPLVDGMGLGGAVEPSSSPLHVAVVTAYPPSQATLNEYGYHLVEELSENEDVGRVTVLADDVAGLPDGSDRLSIVPAWSFDSLLIPLQVVRAVRKAKPDVVVLNMHLTSFGQGKVSAALGLFTPALLRLTRTPSVVVLHNLVDTVDLEKAGYGSNPIARRVLTGIGRILTRIILLANRVAVTVPTYVEILESSYGAKNVYLAPTERSESHSTFRRPRPRPSIG